MARGSAGISFTEVALTGVIAWLVWDNLLRDKIAAYGGLSPLLGDWIPGNGGANGQEDLLVDETIEGEN